MISDPAAQDVLTELTKRTRYSPQQPQRVAAVFPLVAAADTGVALASDSATLSVCVLPTERPRSKPFVPNLERCCGSKQTREVADAQMPACTHEGVPISTITQGLSHNSAQH
jgi:hypothetical protein